MWGNISKGERPPRSASKSQTSSPTFVAAISLVKVMNLPIWKNTKQFTQSSFDWLDLDSAMFSRYGPFNSHSSTTVATYHTNFDIFFWYMFHYVSLKNCPYLQPRLNDHSFPPGLWSMTGRSEALAPLGIWLRPRLQPMGKRLGWRTWLMGVLAREWGYDIKLYIKWWYIYIFPVYQSLYSLYSTLRFVGTWKRSQEAQPLAGRHAVRTSAWAAEREGSGDLGWLWPGWALRKDMKEWNYFAFDKKSHKEHESCEVLYNFNWLPPIWSAHLLYGEAMLSIMLF